MVPSATSKGAVVDTIKKIPTVLVVILDHGHASLLEGLHRGSEIAQIEATNNATAGLQIPHGLHKAVAEGTPMVVTALHQAKIQLLPHGNNTVLRAVKATIMVVIKVMILKLRTMLLLHQLPQASALSCSNTGVHHRHHQTWGHLLHHRIRNHHPLPAWVTTSHLLHHLLPNRINETRL